MKIFNEKMELIGQEKNSTQLMYDLAKKGFYNGEKIYKFFVSKRLPYYLADTVLWLCAPDPKKAKRCAECRDSEHDNLSSDVHLVKVLDNGKCVKRAYICTEHEDCFLTDGYELVRVY